MNPPKTVHEGVAPILTLLGEKIRQRGFTELEVEEVLSWDRSHLQTLKVGRRGLRVAEVLQILDVIGVEPGAFFIELYGTPPRPEVSPAELAELSTLVDSLANLLVKHQVVTAGELARAVAAYRGKDLLLETEEQHAEPPADQPEASG